MDDIRAILVYPSWESRNLVLWWIKEAWAEIPKEMVIKSFKILDGTVDDVVYSEETPEVDDEDMEENEFKTDSDNKWMVSKPLG